MNTYLNAIAALGDGNLHPGGFSQTLKMLSRLSITNDDIVLDIGCGTGRTACHIAKTYGAHVFGLDYSKKMLAKAKTRASREGLDVHFVQGDALDMPFKDEVADLIVVESLLIFLPAHKVLKECFRVLKKRGILVSVEMLAGGSLPRESVQQFKVVCGVSGIPSFGEWIEQFEMAGFTSVIAQQSKFPGLLDNIKEILYIDPYKSILNELSAEHEMSNLLQQYKGLIYKNRQNLGYGTFIMRKGK